MNNIIKISEVAMNVISYSGLAKSCYIEALNFAKNKQFSLIESKMEEGRKAFLKAHEGHLDLLHEEVESREPRISLLMAHAEDQLMNAETLEMIISEIIDIYKIKEL